MVDKIKRADVAQMVRSWKGGEFEPSPGGRIRSPQMKYCFRNAGRRDVDVGNIVYVSSLWTETPFENPPVLPQDKFISAYLNNNLIFVGYSTGSNSGLNLIGVADEPIAKEGGVGYIHFPQQYEFFLAKYNYESDKQAKRLTQRSTAFVIASSGDYRVLATSEKNEDDNTAYALAIYDPLKGPYEGSWYSGAHGDCEIESGHIHTAIPDDSAIIEDTDISGTMYDFLSKTFHDRVIIMRESGVWVPRPISNFRYGTVVSTGTRDQLKYQIRQTETLSPGNTLRYEVTAYQDWFASNEILQEGTSVVMSRDSSGNWRIVNVTCLQEIG